MHTVLMVDDSAAIRKMVEHTLVTAGYRVVTAEDGDIALDLAKSVDPFELVITDVNMPNMDGISLIRELRALDKYQFRPILVLTTESSTEKKMEGKSAGATGWIVKPFVPDQLVDVVQKVLA